MTKLDGTARGGILVALAAKHKLPVHFIGVGEGVDDLAPFAAQGFRQRDRGDREATIMPAEIRTHSSSIPCSSSRSRWGR